MKNIKYTFINYYLPMLNDLKSFLIKWNAIDLAVWFIFGAAFATLVKSFIDNIIMPPIGLLLWKVDFSNLYVSLNWTSYETLAAAEAAGAPIIKYGSFITDTVSFLILGTVIFFMVRAITKLQKEEEAKPHVPAADIVLLTEIRDSLKK